MSDPSNKPIQTRLFLSYAAMTMNCLCGDLTINLIEAGFDVWFDKASMPSNQRPFQQEIRDAIAERDRLVLIVGPKAVVSDEIRNGTLHSR